jgi:hypothetical protein
MTVRMETRLVGIEINYLLLVGGVLVVHSLLPGIMIVDVRHFF